MKKYTRQEFEKSYNKWLNEHDGKQPRYEKWEKNRTYPCCNAIERFFGSWNNFIKEMGGEVDSLRYSRKKYRKEVCDKVLEAVRKKPGELSLSDFTKAKEKLGKNYSGVLYYYEKKHNLESSAIARHILVRDLYGITIRKYHKREQEDANLKKQHKKKLSDEQVKQIAILNRCGIRYSMLEKEFGVCAKTIREAKKRANVGREYKKQVRHGKSFKFALENYNSTHDELIKKKIEHHVFLPFVNMIIENYSQQRLLPSRTDNYLKFLHAILRASNLREYLIKPQEEEIRKIAYEEIKNAFSKDDLVENIENRLLERYYKPFPPVLKRGIDKNLLNGLEERLKEVLIERFGLRDGKPKTFQEVGRIFNLSRERIRQIEEAALQKLRHPTRTRDMENVIDSYKNYLKNDPQDYEGKEELISIIDELTKSFEGVKGGLDARVRDILDKRKSQLENFSPTKQVEKSLYLDLTSLMLSYSANIDRKLNSLIMLASKNHSPQDINKILDDQDIFILEREKLREKLKIPTKELELSVRASCCLAEAGIKYVGDIASHSEEQLLSFRNFGKKSLSEIKQLLDGMDLQLNMKDLPKYK